MTRGGWFAEGARLADELGILDTRVDFGRDEPFGVSLEALRVRLAYTPANGSQRTVTRETLNIASVDDATYRSLNAHPDVLEALALFEVARAKVEMIQKLDQGDDNAVKDLLQTQAATLAAAPASARVRKEQVALEELKADFGKDRAVTRKKAGSQAYEKQRGY